MAASKSNVVLVCPGILAVLDEVLWVTGQQALGSIMTFSVKDWVLCMFEKCPGVLKKVPGLNEEIPCLNDTMLGVLREILWVLGGFMGMCVYVCVHVCVTLSRPKRLR